MSIIRLGTAQPTDTVAKKNYVVTRVTEAPVIDGVMNDPVWEQGVVATGFVQRSPNPGAKSRQRTEVVVLYDDKAIYVGARLYDNHSDSILRQFTARDDDGNTDVFGIFFDTYDNDLDAFEFFVTAAGVQQDRRRSFNDNDRNWNAAWFSEVSIDDKNWYVEMRIPYSALRFSKEKVQNWGLNFYRRIRRHRENSNWQFVNPEVNGEVNQYGTMSGLTDVESPVRLFFSPFVQANAEHNPNNSPGNDDWNRSFSAGLDVKYGINDAFTLDMTLIPDFTQVQSDNQILNLGPFEQRFDENRPFFTEGLELFNKGNIFFSRRVGGVPIDRFAVFNQLREGEEITENPDRSQLLNATKVSGRTSKGLGIGVFNGVTQAMFATARDTLGNTRKLLTDPLTNFNVFVLDQNLKNNSSISLVNTNVLRSGAHYDANVTAGVVNLTNKKNTIRLNTEGKVSQKIGSEFAGGREVGYNYGLSLAKISGNWNYEGFYFVEDDKWDPNDLGFLFNNNSRVAGGEISYNIFEPFWNFVNFRASIANNYERLFNPNVFTDYVAEANVRFVWKSFFAHGFGYVVQPFETFDYFEPRVPGRFYTNPTNSNYSAWISSDYRKVFALDANANFRTFTPGRYRFNVRVAPRIRVSDKLMLIFNLNRRDWPNDEGAAILRNGGSTVIGDDVIFSKRDRVSWENIINANYIFTNKMSLSLRVRHNWTTVKYNEFFVLTEDGYLRDSDYTGNDVDGTSLHNTSFNAFNIDLNYSWIFAANSELSINWKNSILNSSGQIANAYFDNLGSTLDDVQTNSFSIKFLYFLDYLSLKRTKPEDL